MAEQPVRAERDVPFRACCGKLRWALMDAVESLPAGSHVGALRWGPAEIPVDVEVGAVSPVRAVDAILDAAEARLGPASACYAGQGALMIDGTS